MLAGPDRKWHYTDNFNANVNYLTNGLAGTIWDGVYFGAGEFNNTGPGRRRAGRDAPMRRQYQRGQQPDAPDDRHGVGGGG